MTTTPPPPDDSNQPAGFGDLPVHPGTPAEDPGRAAPATGQPSSIRLAVRLMWAGAVLSLVGLVVTLATLDTLKSDIRDSLRKSDHNYTQSTLDAAYGVAIGFAVFFALVGAGLWLWMAWKNGEGRSWARIVATVAGGLNLLSTIYVLAAGQSTGASIAVTVVNLILAAVILVLLWRKESSQFYASRSQPRLA